MEAPNDFAKLEQNSLISNSSEVVFDDSSNLANENVFLDQTSNTTAAQAPFIQTTNEPAKRAISLVSSAGTNNCTTEDNYSEEPMQSSNWMMNFETPEKQTKRASLYSPSPICLQSSSVSQLPSSNQIDELMKELTQKHSSEIFRLQEELQEWKDKCQLIEQKYSSIERTLHEYCTTMNEIAEQTKKLEEENSTLIVENEAFQKTLSSERIALENMSNDCMVMKRKEEAMDSSISSLQRELIASQKKYELLKVHAEEKLEEANQELSRFKNAYDSECSLLKVKLSKSELKIKSLENVIDMKTKENKELMDICDDLIQKMDAK